MTGGILWADCRPYHIVCTWAHIYGINKFHEFFSPVPVIHRTEQAMLDFS